MSEYAIKVENLGKKYLLRHKVQGRYVALRDVVAEKVKGLFKSRQVPSESGKAIEEFWALEDVSFEVKPGDAVGIIGRNGAGKSTLLKLLSRIMEPTLGCIRLRGRVASLLEVGTGFHPELTGRENIFLNGAILGMSRIEIKRRFDEIVDFAEVEKFLDTPVKRYSSGMYMRLAFAVAAHLEPEILIVDEVLAVGDAQFQKKCLGKMQDVSAKEGRTILFVSHNMTAVESLTSRCIYLRNGKVEADGRTKDVVASYLSSRDQVGQFSIAEWPQRSGTGEARFVHLDFCNLQGKACDTFRPLEPIRIKTQVDLSKELPMDIAIVIEDEKEQALFCSHLSDSMPVTRMSKTATFSVLVNPNYLRPGKYRLSLASFRPDYSDYYDTVLHFPGFEIAGEGVEYKVPNDHRWGSLFFNLKWSAD